MTYINICCHVATSRGRNYYYGSKGGRLHMEEDEVNGWFNQEQDFHQEHHCWSIVKVNCELFFGSKQRNIVGVMRYVCVRQRSRLLVVF